MHVDTWDDFSQVFAGEGSKFVYAHWDGTPETELAIKAETKVTIRCLPLAADGPAEDQTRVEADGSEGHEVEAVDGEAGHHRPDRLHQAGLGDRRRLGASPVVPGVAVGG